MKFSLLPVTLLLLLSPLFGQISGHQDWQQLPLRCKACHVGHGLSGTAMLPLEEEDFCFQCHGDNSEFEKAARTNKVSAAAHTKKLRSVFKKPYRHPVELKSHKSNSLLSGGENIFGATRSECLDCHRGHGVSRISYAKGVTAKRSTRNEREFQYQLCYKCHAAILQTSQNGKNIKNWFDTVNPSYHPIESTGKNTECPSLKRPYTVAGVINCTDCHNNDDLSGPQGPHGSNYQYLLEKNYNRNDYIPESSHQYELCYKCHDRQSLLNDESFPHHRSHIVLTQTSCFTCHNSHGSQKNTHLIRFGEETDPMVVRPSSSGRLEFLDNGRFAGECYLSCHGVDHDPKVYRSRR